MTTEKECLAVILSIEKFRPYIEGVKFVVYTDHASLLWLHKFKDTNGRLVRWALRLQAYNFELRHKKGKHMNIPDCLSRMYEVEAVDFDSFTETADDKYKQIVSETLSNSGNSEFHFTNNLLYRRNHENENRVYVPEDMKGQVLHECHDEKTAAHGGVFKTLHRVKKLYYWPNMDTDIRAYVNKCKVCKAVKQANYNLTAPMGKQRTPQRPWQMIAIDFVGPLPRSSSGNKWILTIVDCFSKMSIVCPCRDATAKIVNKCLEEKVFLVYGVPEIIICDNGSQFKSRLFSALCERFRISIWFTPVYHAQANPSEAVNKIIGNALRCYIIDEGQKEWDRNISHITCAINTSVHSSTNKSPFEIIYGHSHNITGQHGLVDLDKRPLVKNIENTRAGVAEFLRKAYEKAKKRYDLRARPISFVVGEPVYRRNFSLSNKAAGYASKLAPRYVKGIIIGKCSSHVYIVRDDGGKRDTKFHTKDLKKA